MDDLVHDVFREIHRNGKADSLIASGPAENRRIDANQFALGVDQCTTGVSGIDGSVGLNKIFVLLDSQTATTGCADDAHRDSLADSERVSDGQHDVADLNIYGIREADNGQTRLIDFQDSQICLAVFTDNAR